MEATNPKHYQKVGFSILVAFGVFFGTFTFSHAVSTFITSQGGTGTTSPSGILYGDNGSTTHLNTVSIGTGLTFSGGTLSSTGGGGIIDPFTHTTNFGVSVSATSTPIWDMAGLMASSTSYLASTTVFTEAADGFQIISKNSSHAGDLTCLTAGSCEWSFNSPATGSGTTHGSSIGLGGNTTNLRLFNREPTGGLQTLVGNTTDAFDILSTGLVGIGSTTPWAQLAASSSSAFPAFAVEQLGSGASAIFKGGNVGVGTTSPGTLFAIQGIANFTTGTTTWAASGGVNFIGTIGCPIAISGVCLSTGGGTIGSGTTGQFPYYASAGTTLTATSSLFLASSGSIGIGTTSPAAQLAIQGLYNIFSPIFSIFGSTVSQSQAVGYLIVGGGGGGGHDFGSGGGAGGLLQGTTTLSTGAYAIVVGGGGAENTNGSDSTAIGLTAVGGGGGVTLDTNGKNGGSGSGGGGKQTAGTTTGGTGTAGQGNNGGTGTLGAGGAGNNDFVGGGGGGSGSVGANGNSATHTSGSGGSGTTSSITGASTCYAGGGGAGGYNGPSSQPTIAGSATCGGGGGSGGNGTAGTNGTANTGGGGGGGAGGGGNGGTGGSGVVIFRYPTANASYYSCSGSTTTSGIYTICTFTGNGTFTVGTGSGAADTVITMATSTGLTVGYVSGVSGGGFTSTTTAVGVGTSSPTSTFSVQGFAGTIVRMVAGFIGSTKYLYEEVDSIGHFITGGPSPSCGTGCSSVVGDDRNMRVTTGSAVSSITVNFANTYTKTPSCIGTEESAGSVAIGASSTPTTVVITTASALTTKFIAVHCEISSNFTF